MNGWLEIWRYQEEPWEFVWLSQGHGMMKAGDKVRVLRRVDASESLLVDHPTEDVKRVGVSLVSPPVEFKTARGQWIPESDPRARSFLEKALADVRDGGKKVEASGDPLLRQRTMEEISWMGSGRAFNKRIASGWPGKVAGKHGGIVEMREMPPARPK